MKPLKFLPDADLEGADRLLVDLLVGNMTVRRDRFLILSWLSCFPADRLRRDAAHDPLRGSAGSGKTTASKITSLLYGEPQHRRPPTRRTAPMARRTRSSSSTTSRSSR